MFWYLQEAGGSLEDLWPFNEEIVAREIYNSEIPIISAVGHETDFSISDFVADLRAPTPSAAAELAVSNIADVKNKLETYNNRFKMALKKKTELMRLRYEKCMTRRVFKEPLQDINEKYMKIDMLYKSLTNNMQNIMNSKKIIASKNISKLDALSPLKTLSRGYSIIEKDEKIVKSIKELNKNDEIKINLSDGKKAAKII